MPARSESRPCLVTDERGVHPGTVRTWFRERGEWCAVVEYRHKRPDGWTEKYLRRMPAAALRPRGEPAEAR